jgi:hypothetical protein
MDWNVISAVATIIGTILTFISIIVAVGIEKQKNMSSQSEGERRVSPEQQSLVVKRTQYPYLRDNDFKIHENAEKNKTHDPYAPFLYIMVGIIGACGGAASILVPWLLLQASPELQCILYPLLVMGIIGGTIFALVMDNHFEMNKATPYLRFPLSAICGVIGGWLGLLIIVGVFLYMAATAPPPTPIYKISSSRDDKSDSTMERMSRNWNVKNSTRR